MRLKNMSAEQKEKLYRKTIKRTSIAETLEILFFSLAIVGIFISGIVVPIDQLQLRGTSILVSLLGGSFLGIVCLILAKVEAGIEDKLSFSIEKDKQK